MKTIDKTYISLQKEAKKAALEVLIYNSRGPFRGLPRAAGWKYPEPGYPGLDDRIPGNGEPFFLRKFVLHKA